MNQNLDLSEIVFIINELANSMVVNNKIRELFYLFDDFDNNDICNILISQLDSNFHIITKENKIIVFLVNDKFIIVDYTQTTDVFFRIFKLLKFEDFSEVNEYINFINN